MAKFAWKAIYEDCKMYQNWVTGEGNSFGEVQAKGMPLCFYIGTRFGVNLKSGELLIKGVWTSITNKYGDPLRPTELVYFRRVTQHYNTGGDSIKPTIWHFVGYKYSAGTICIRVSNDERNIYSIWLGDE